MTHENVGQPSDRDELLALLGWYRELGVDAAVSSQPVDWLARGDIPPKRADALLAGAPATQTGEPPPVHQQNAQLQRSGPTQGRGDGSAGAPRSFVSAPPDEAVADARDAAGNAADLTALREALSRFDGCGLRATAKNLCFYRGAEQARVMVIGEAPGRDEDRSGMPFVGRAGQLLDKMLTAISLDEATVHVTNVVYWRPPGNRTPTPQEVLVCRPFLDRQIELVAPDLIVTVGGPATKAILDTTQGIMRMRGKWGKFELSNGRQVDVMATLHPAYLLRTPAAKRLAWRDLLAVRAKLDGNV